MKDKFHDDLMASVIEFLVKRSNADLSKDVPFIEAFTEACIKQRTTRNVFVQITPRTRDQIRENLIKNNYVIDNSEEVEMVFITQKAIDKFSLLAKAKACEG